MDLVAGVDEAGRGPWAGPVVAAAVILGRAAIPGIADSKRLSPKRREGIAVLIESSAIAYGVGMASVREIERLNVVQATFVAMCRAIAALPVRPDRVLVDGLFRIPQIGLPQEAIVRGDASEPAISAASILAKVARDALMREYDFLYPQYGFAQHKGYGTAAHLRALLALGPCPIHRRTFAPVLATQGSTEALSELLESRFAGG